MCGVECVRGLLLAPSVKLSFFFFFFFFFVRVVVSRNVFVCFVYDVSGGVVSRVRVCLLLCVWLFVFEIKCVADV